jgi:hypothetical protein
LIVVGKLERLGFGVAEQAGELAERLARDQRLLFAGDAFKGFAELFDVGQPMPIRRDGPQRLALVSYHPARFRPPSSLQTARRVSSRAATERLRAARRLRAS